MKSFSGFIPNDRRAWHRAQLLELLGGDEALVEQIERAENDYLFFVQGVATNDEKAKPIKKDLEALVKAFEALQKIYKAGGSAKALLEGEACRLVGAAPLQALRSAFEGVPGEHLLMAARAALEKHQGRAGQPPLLARRWLVDGVAHVAAQAKIKVKRPDRDDSEAPFFLLLNYVFDRVGIESDSVSVVDNAIRDYLENRAK